MSALGDYQRRKKFGITPEQYKATLKDQDYRCAICEEHADNFDRSFAVDHDHVTGRIRGLLCLKCNTGLGCFDDKKSLVYTAYHYLCHSKASGLTQDKTLLAPLPCETEMVSIVKTATPS